LGLSRGGTTGADPAGPSPPRGPTGTGGALKKKSQASSSRGWMWRGAIGRGGLEGPPASRHSAITKSPSVDPMTCPESEGATIGELISLRMIAESPEVPPLGSHQYSR